MLVQCVSNLASHLSRQALEYESVDRAHKYDGILPMQLYVVYAIDIIEGSIRYRVDSSSSGYPSELFAILDGRISRSWVTCQPRKLQCALILGFERYARDAAFMRSLVEGADDAVSTFNKCARFMDLEFPDPRIAHKAIHVQSSWVQCPLCSDAWEADDNNGMTECPSCRTIMHNPQYIARPKVE